MNNMKIDNEVVAVKFVNLTPHSISVAGNDGEIRTFTPSGIVARVSVSTISADDIGGFATSSQVFGEIENLPAQQQDTFYIVSAMVKDRTKRRNDVISPDTGISAVRNEKGHIKYVKGFIR